MIKMAFKKIFKVYFYYGDACIHFLFIIIYNENCIHLLLICFY